MESDSKFRCKKFDKLQERAIRIIHYKKVFVDSRRVYQDPNDLMKKYEIDNLNVQRKQQLLSLMHVQYTKRHM